MRRPMRAVPAALAVLAGMAAVPAPARADTVFFSLGDRVRCRGEALCQPLPFQIEPAIRVDTTTGNAWLTVQNAIPNGAHIFRRTYGTGQRFRYVDRFDQVPVVTQRTGLALGGGDTDLAIGSTGTVHAVSLWAGANTLAAYDQAGTLIHRQYLAGKPLVDRQWIAADGPSTLYMTYWDFFPPRNIWVSKSTDGGLTWGLPVSSGVGANAFAPYSGIGNIVVDQRNGNVFNLFSVDAGAGERLVLTRSTDGGQTWVNRNIHVDPAPNEPGSHYSALFPSMAVDRAGNLFAVWSDEANVFLSSSTDMGDTWTAPVQVNDPVLSRTSLFPWIAAGSAGRVAIAWIGGAAVSPANPDPHQPFYAYFAMTINGTDAAPAFDRGRASDDAVHRQGICLEGLGCSGFRGPEPPEPLHDLIEPVLEPLYELIEFFGPALEPYIEPVLEAIAEPLELVLGERQSDAGNRDLAEVVQVAVDVDGLALVAYPDDFEGGVEVATISVVSKQATGNRLYAPGDYPNPAFEPPP